MTTTDVAAEHRGVATTADARPSRWVTRRRAARLLIPIGLFLLAFLPRLLSVGGASADEPRWLGRSEHYLDAYTSLDLANATSTSSGGGTMPGITTSLVGGVAKIVWSGADDLGIIDPGPYPFTDSRDALIISQALMAAANAALVVLLWWVLRRWINLRVATVAAVILATEPFLVVHGARLTTDSFVTLFGAIGTFALASALGIPRPLRSVRLRRTMAAVAGVGLAGALASKLSFLASGPFLVALIVLAVARRNRAPSGREVTGVLLVTTGAGIATLAVLWPALWVDPGGQLAVMRASADQVGIVRRQFFFGEPTTDPGVFFYPVVMAFRTTPWLFVLGLASPLAFVRRSTRPYAVLMVASSVVPLLVITFAGLKYDRYALPLWPAGAVLAALVVEVLVHEVGHRWPSVRRAIVPAMGLGLAAIWIATMTVVPDAGVYANPALGGGHAAQDVILIGGPSASRVGELIEAREGDDCDRRRIFATISRGHLRFPCGEIATSIEDLRPGDYIVVDTSSVTRGSVAEDAYRERGKLVAHVRRRGVDLADVIVVR